MADTPTPTKSFEALFTEARSLNDTDKSERARRAVKAFQALQPTLTAYARVLTKNNRVRVELAARDNGSTDGSRIFYRPPLALGDPATHDRHLCDKRDETHQLLCVACNNREKVLVVIYHEIAHIAFGTFEKPTDKDVTDVIQEAVRMSGGWYGEVVKKRLADAPAYKTNDFINLASLISEFLPIVYNALEDARVNRELFKARKGTKVMFDADTWRVFTNGVEQKSHTGEVVVKMWTEYPLNMQAIIGVFCKAAGYDYSQWLVPRIVEALADPALTALIAKLATVRDTVGAYRLSFPVLQRLVELGYCKEERDEPKPPEPSPKSEEPTEEKDESDDDTDDTDSDADGESESSDSESSDGESDESDGESGSGGGNSTGSGSSGSSGTDTQDEEDEDNTDTEDGDEANENGDDDDAADDEASSEEDEGADDAGDDADGDGREDGDRGGSDGSGGRSESGDGPDDEDDGDSDESDDSEGADEPSEAEPGADATGVAGDDEQVDAKTSNKGSGSTPTLETESSSEGPGGSGSSGASGYDQDEEVDAIDQGADEGEGGIQTEDNEANDDIPMGTAEESFEGLIEWGGHDEKPKTIAEEKAEQAEFDAMDRAIIQGIYFETPSRYINGVREHRYGSPIMAGGYNMSRGWDAVRTARTRSAFGMEADTETNESLLGSALLKMRVAFADNDRSSDSRNRKSGKIDGRVLGKRAPFKDDRMFKKRTVPGKRDYFVIIGIDISGSTAGINLVLAKKAAFAQANLLTRMGIKFAVYGHSGNYHNPAEGRGEGLDLDIYIIKEPDEPWTPTVQERLTEIGPDAANLDGHTIEYYRKIMDRVTATDKILLYYTDGKMPAENHDEELEILQREIKTFKQKGYHLLGVGIRTDSPRRHGLNTVQVEEEKDIELVIAQLRKELLAASSRK